MHKRIVGTLKALQGRRYNGTKWHNGNNEFGCYYKKASPALML
ncbi:hypothetical protein [Leuconostoc carnosum]|nr:hypothetical protein [Leuconostoc carnosum]